MSNEEHHSTVGKFSSYENRKGILPISWDREIIHEGTFVFHPEYVYALAKQGMVPDPSLLLGIDPLLLAKGS